MVVGVVAVVVFGVWSLVHDKVAVLDAPPKRRLGNTPTRHNGGDNSWNLTAGFKTSVVYPGANETTKGGHVVYYVVS